MTTQTKALATRPKLAVSCVAALCWAWGYAMTARARECAPSSGATTWETTLVDNGRAYKVAWPDGGGFNPGYRIGKEPTSYPGINADYRRTHHVHEMLRPDIFLAAHAEWLNYEQKRERAKSDGVQAWVNPEQYRQFVAKQKRAFEDQVDLEMGVAK